MEVQWLRLQLPMQGVESLIRKLDPTCFSAKKDKTENRSNVVTNSVKTLKMVHIFKTLKKVLKTSELYDPPSASRAVPF